MAQKGKPLETNNRRFRKGTNKGNIGYIDGF